MPSVQDKRLASVWIPAFFLEGPEQWRNFMSIIDKAKIACENAGMDVADHFADVSKTIAMPKSAEKEVVNYMLTRYA
jgi:DNA-damage-inducible protein D